jgi:hypothetical protein
MKGTPLKRLKIPTETPLKTFKLSIDTMISGFMLVDSVGTCWDGTKRFRFHL